MCIWIWGISVCSSPQVMIFNIFPSSSKSCNVTVSYFHLGTTFSCCNSPAHCFHTCMAWFTAGLVCEATYIYNRYKAAFLNEPLNVLGSITGFSSALDFLWDHVHGFIIDCREYHWSADLWSYWPVSTLNSMHGIYLPNLVWPQSKI